MEVINDLLGYDNMKIIQNTDMFSFSLDSVLLANFVSLNKKIERVLDIGCGNAPIPLILSTKTNAAITGVEIQKDVYELAKKSLEINDLTNRISLINDNLFNIVYWDKSKFSFVFSLSIYSSILFSIKFFKSKF